MVKPFLLHVYLHLHLHVFLNMVHPAASAVAHEGWAINDKSHLNFLSPFNLYSPYNVNIFPEDSFSRQNVVPWVQLSGITHLSWLTYPTKVV